MRIWFFLTLLTVFYAFSVEAGEQLSCATLEPYRHPSVGIVSGIKVFDEGAKGARISFLTESPFLKDWHHKGHMSRKQHQLIGNWEKHSLSIRIGQEGSFHSGHLTLFNEYSYRIICKSPKFFSKAPAPNQM